MIPIPAAHWPTGRCQDSAARFAAHHLPGIEQLGTTWDEPISCFFPQKQQKLDLFLISFRQRMFKVLKRIECQNDGNSNAGLHTLKRQHENDR